MVIEYSIIVPIRNEESFIRAFLLNIEQQTLDKKKYEVLLIDGLSTDKTKVEIEKVRDQLTFNLTIVNNEKKIIPAALNIGYRKAKGHTIIRLDVHSSFGHSYLEQLITFFGNQTDCCNIGGRTIAKGYNSVSNHIAYALNTPFGVGGAKFRYAQEMTEVDSVFPGIFRKQDLLAIGGWNEEWVINEDAELNYRLKKYTKKHIKVIPNAAIQIEYYPRSTLRAFVKQFYNYGLWRNKTNVNHPTSMRISHLIPPLFVLGLIVTMPLLFVNKYLAIIPLTLLGSYLLIIRGVIGNETPENLSYSKLLIVFLLLHLSWGAGSIKGYFVLGVPFKGIMQLFSSNVEKLYKAIQRA